jgi:hypothetical protein
MSLEPDQRLKDAEFRAIAFGWCIDYLDAAITLLSQPPTPKLATLGWSSKTLRELRALVAEWRSDLEEDGTFTKRQHRIMIRWFLDADLDYPAVSLLLASADNLIHDALEMASGL